ncbi:MAG: pyruvate carboxyltransferase, partial [Bacteroidetes bacterium]|nr:pyruvate carboxyltransferase [Bacteroidota bacterium]
LLNDVSLTAVTIRERAIERAIQAKLDGYGPDRILLMVSTSESHQKKNSGLSLNDYWKMAEEYIPKAREAGIKVNGTVSTIWGCPIEGPTDMSDAIDFAKRWLDIGANDVEHADHDGSASPDRVYKYFSMLMDQVDNPDKHIVHFHTTRGWGLANVLAALQAGMTNYESTMGGIGGQPANMVDGVPVSGTGAYYYKESSNVGLVTTEDMVVMMDEMGIETNLDIDRVLETGKMVEKIVGRKLRSECVHQGRIPKSLSGRE